MTEQQINIEFEHLLIDKEERAAASGGQVYEDEEYEKDEAEEERIDSKLYVEGDFEEIEPLPKYDNDNDGEWVDVEIDDDEDY